MINDADIVLEAGALVQDQTMSDMYVPGPQTVATRHRRQILLNRLRVLAEQFLAELQTIHTEVPGHLEGGLIADAQRSWLQYIDETVCTLRGLVEEW